MIDLSQVRDDILLERYNELSQKYKLNTDELKEFVIKLMATKNEIGILEVELKKRSLIDNDLRT